jgi:hypothetical protein
LLKDSEKKKKPFEFTGSHGATIATAQSPTAATVAIRHA